MRAVHGKDTAPEMLIRSNLHRLGYRFRLHWRGLPGTPDIVFPSRKGVLFIHGCFWHGHDCRRGALPATHVAFWTNKISANRDRDKRAVRNLKKRGWKVLTIWECETKNVNKLLQKIRQFLERASMDRDHSYVGFPHEIETRQAE